MSKKEVIAFYSHQGSNRYYMPLACFHQIFEEKWSSGASRYWVAYDHTGEEYHLTDDTAITRISAAVKLNQTYDSKAECAELTSQLAHIKFNLRTLQGR
jgi:hypothetical protein